MPQVRSHPGTHYAGLLAARPTRRYRGAGKLGSACSRRARSACLSRPGWRRIERTQALQMFVCLRNERGVGTTLGFFVLYMAGFEEAVKLCRRWKGAASPAPKSLGGVPALLTRQTTEFAGSYHLANADVPPTCLRRLHSRHRPG